MHPHPRPTPSAEVLSALQDSRPSSSGETSFFLRDSGLGHHLGSKVEWQVPRFQKPSEVETGAS